MIGKVGVAYRVWFSVRNGDGTPRAGLVGGNFAVEVKAPSDPTSGPSTPTVVESLAGDGQYYFDIPGSFTTTNGAGQYGWTVRVTLAPVDLIGDLVDFRVQSVDDFVDTYQAKVWLFDDNIGGNDCYAAAWFKNGEPVLAGITVPTIQVIDLATGLDLIAVTAMTAVGATGYFRKDEAVNRVVSGTCYMAQAKATIDGQVRVWSQPVGRDS